MAPKRKSSSDSSKRSFKKKRSAVHVSRSSVLRSRQGFGEVKNVDVLGGALTLNSTPQFTLLNGIEEGSGRFERIGRKVHMQSVRVIFGVRAITGRTLNEDDLRLMLIYDSQTNGAMPAIADVLQSINSAGTTTSLSNSAPNMSNSERFTILRDWKKAVSLETPSIVQFVNSSDGQPYDWFVKFPQGRETTFTGAGATVASISKGSLFLMAVGVIAAASEAFAIRLFSTRVRYRD